MTKQMKRTQFEELVSKTVKEMTSDLANIDSTKSDHLKSITNGLSNRRIVKRLANPESELCKAIPVDLLEKDVAGKKYLDILCMIQPKLKHPQQPLPQSDTELNKLSSSMQLSQPKDDFMKMFGETMDPELLNLANMVRQDLNMDEGEIKDLVQEMDVGKMMDLFNKVRTNMETKIENGEINVDKLQTQTMDFVSKLKNAPEFDKVLNDNPGLSMMMNAGQASPLSSLSSLTEFAGMMMPTMD